MLEIQQVKRLALQNAQGSTGEGGSVRSAAVPPGLHLSAGVAFGALEVVWGAHLSAGVAFGALEDSSECLDLCEDVELSLGSILAYDCL